MKFQKNWLNKTGERILIAGPCSAESPEQVLETAKQIAVYYPDAIFRAGIWKPRTRPGQFEGAGEEALLWLAEVKKQTGLRIATEIALPRHFELAYKHGIDFYWIGTRTTVNPFMIQELAEAMKGTDIPVLVKNPIHPDLQLWKGAIERFYVSGIKRLAAIHRGFFTYEHSTYRNAPRWELIMELREMIPGIPMICDVSHIAGDTSLLQTIAQQAADLSVDGFMIETHVDPTHALSDAHQQITPFALKELLMNLKNLNASFPEKVVSGQLQSIRKQIDDVDQQLLKILGDRMLLTNEIAGLKLEHQVSVLQIERWKELISQCMTKADAAGLYRDFIKNIFIQIHDESIRQQMMLIMEREKTTDKAE